jgi:hypothetical protein
LVPCRSAIATTASDPATTAVVATEPTTIALADSPPTEGARFHGVGHMDDGYAIAIDIYFGMPHHLSDLPLPPLGRPLIASSDDSRTTVIPVRVMLTNKTPNFAAALATNWCPRVPSGRRSTSTTPVAAAVACRVRMIRLASSA